MERILVVPFADGIGDFIMMLPLLRAIHRRFPTATITVAASARSSLLLNEDDRIAVRTPAWLKQTPGPRGGSLRQLAPQAVLARLAGLALRWELRPADRLFNFFHWWEQGMDFARHWTPSLPPRLDAIHTLDYLADRLGQELGVVLSPEQRQPLLSPRPAATAWARDWWTGAGLDGRLVVGLAPTSNMAIKRWPAPRWQELAAGLSALGATPLLLLPPTNGGGRLDHVEHHSAEAADAPRGRPAVIAEEWYQSGPANGDLASVTPVARAALDHVAALLARCSLVIGVDTGLLHMAAAVGTRYVGLFGPTNPAVTGPYNQGLGISLVAPFMRSVDCRGCWRHFKYEFDYCRAQVSGSCMQALSVEAVLSATQEQLAGHRDVASPLSHCPPAPESLATPVQAVRC